MPDEIRHIENRPEIMWAENRSLLLTLRYAGQVGSGLNEFLLRHLGSAFEELASDTSPFVPPPPVPPLHFVRPSLVVEVMFNEMTTAGVLRQPSVKGLRNDVDPAGVGWTDELG